MENMEDMGSLGKLGKPILKMLCMVMWFAQIYHQLGMRVFENGVEPPNGQFHRENDDYVWDCGVHYFQTNPYIT